MSTEVMCYNPECGAEYDARHGDCPGCDLARDEQIERMLRHKARLAEEDNQLMAAVERHLLASAAGAISLLREQLREALADADDQRGAFHQSGEWD